MGFVMIICPVTGRAVSTGIATEFATLQQAAAFQICTRCGACGGEHRWSPGDAWICDTIPFERPAAA